MYLHFFPWRLNILGLPNSLTFPFKQPRLSYIDWPNSHAPPYLYRYSLSTFLSVVFLLKYCSLPQTSFAFLSDVPSFMTSPPSLSFSLHAAKRPFISSTVCKTSAGSNEKNKRQTREWQTSWHHVGSASSSPLPRSHSAVSFRIATKAYTYLLPMMPFKVVFFYIQHFFSVESLVFKWITSSLISPKFMVVQLH